MKETVGFVGLGKMGLPMARKLLEHDYIVYGSDLDGEAMAAFKKSGGVPSFLKEIIENAAIIILMLPNSKVVNQVIEELRSFSGKTRTKELTVIDMSSSYPVDTQKNSNILSKDSIAMIDAPVSGGVKKAVTGELTIMVGGEKEYADRANELFHAMGKNIYHVGPIGSGHLMKALNNFLSAVHLLATSEAVHLLENFGIDPETGIEVFNQSTGRSHSTAFKFPKFILPETFDSGFSLELMAKDVDTAKKLFEDKEADSKLAAEVASAYLEAHKEFGDESDHTEIFRFVSKYINLKGDKFHV